MIITPNADPVVHNIDKAKIATFKVARQSRKLVQVIVRSLYSNPTLATLVELGQNAHDEHIRCGKADVPFEVTLPTLFEPTLKVRDFGRGIPHSYMMEGYTHIFQSTKDDEEDMSGGYGIGRCVVLSLSSTYTVTTYINGIERTYSVFESDNGIELIHMSTKETTESDGTLVIAPVSQNEVQAFPDAAQRAYRYYKTVPIIKGAGSNFVIHTPVYTMQGSGWSIENNNNGSSAICGIYHYPIEAINMGNLTEAQKTLLDNIGIVLHFGPSDLDVQANRQGLNYSERTREAIIKALNVAISEAGQLVQKRFDNCKSFYEAKSLWNEMYDNHSLRRFTQIGKATNNVTWNNIPILSGRVELKGVSGLVATGFTWKYIGRTDREIIKHTHYWEMFECGKGFQHLFINDLPGGKGGIRRVKNFLHEFHEKDGNKHTAVVLYFHTQKDKLDFLANSHLTEDVFTKVSTLPKTTSGRVSYNYDRARCKVFVYNPESYNGHANSTAWDIAEDFDVTEKGYYVLIDAFRPFYKNHVYKVGYFDGFLNDIIALGGLKNDETIFGVRNTATEQINEMRKNGWKTLDEYVTELVSNYVVPDADIATLQKSSQWEKVPTILKNIVNYKYENKLMDCEILQNIFNTIVNFKKIDEEIAAINSKHSVYVRHGGLLSFDSKSSVAASNEIDIPTEYNKFVRSYPLFPHLDYWSGEQLSHFNNMVKMIEKKS